jgi:hypothetical protein
MTERELNQSIADTLREDFAWNGRMFREGQYVSLLDGKIVAVSENLRDAVMAVRGIDPDPQRGMVVPISHPVVDVIR